MILLLMAIIVVNGGADFYTTMVSYGSLTGQLQGLKLPA